MKTLIKNAAGSESPHYLVGACMGTRVEMVRTFDKHGVGAELGVFEGAFSKVLLREAEPAWLWLVDTFEGTVHSGDANGEHVRAAKMDAVMVALLSDKGLPSHRVVVWRQDSVSFLRESELRLDWVYIDTIHTYEQTRLELSAARKAVRDGGIISGHDYNEEQFPGVIKAVQEFVKKHELELQIWAGDKLASYKIVNRR